MSQFDGLAHVRCRTGRIVRGLEKAAPRHETRDPRHRIGLGLGAGQRLVDAGHGLIMKVQIPEGISSGDIGLGRGRVRTDTEKQQQSEKR